MLLEAQRVTFARNVCDDVNVRCVKSVDGGNAHMVNNVLKNWRGIEIVYAKNDSMVLADHNIFQPGSDSRLAGRVTGDGQLQDTHNVQRSGGRYRSYRMGNREDVEPAFKAEAQAAYGIGRKVDCEHDPPDQACWRGLYDVVMDGAGADVSFR